MAAPMPGGRSGQHSGASTAYDHDAAALGDDDLIDADDDATLDDLDDPVAAAADADRAPLTGPLSSSSSSAPPRAAAAAAQGYLTSSLGGEDRRAPMHTLDESVWHTLRRDLLAVADKMRHVLYPKYLLGGIMAPGGGGMGGGGVEGGGGGGAAGRWEQLRGVVGRWPDADAVLQGGMSEGLRDWDLWGPLLFCLLLSFFLSLNARETQRSAVFSGVFATIWIGEAVVTLQIKLLGGNISFFQSVCIIGYTLFPMVIASVLSAFHVHWIVRVPVYSLLGLWSLAAGVSILGGSGVVKNRVALAIFPLFIFYLGVDCLCFIS